MATYLGSFSTQLDLKLPLDRCRPADGYDTLAYDFFRFLRRPQEGFSTDGSAQRLILNTIAQTKPGGEICIAAFAFTNKTIADALIKAADKGVRVGVVVDSEQAAKQYSSIPYLVHAGISVRVDDKHFEMHNKFMVVDLKTVQTGSFNYTSAAAKHNAENVIVIHEDSHLVEAYLREWKEHWNHSKPAQFRD